jgi:hypothetical protein
VCGVEQAGLAHRTSAALWASRLGRAREHGGVDPVSGEAADAAAAHLAAIEGG